MNVSPPVRRTLLLLALALLATGLGTWLALRDRPDAAANHESPALPRAIAYIGSTACQGCHTGQTQAWQGSQHQLALQLATPQTMLGHVGAAPLRFGRNETRFARQGDDTRVRSEGADGKPVDLPLTHVIGLAPLQQYLVSQRDGRKQALGVAWDARAKANGGQRWFHIFPKEGTQPGHPLHWAGIDQTWNYQCADCHSTNLRKGYDAASDSYRTTWSEISVGCEACHGPGQAHVAWAQSKASPAPANYGLSAQLDERKAGTWQVGAGETAMRSAPRTSQREIEVCARCHARRGQFSDEHRAGDPLLDHFRPALLQPGLYYADGQQRDEVYNHASFLQSRMHAAGVTCSDCHEPHSGKLRAQGNAVCTQCHAAKTFDAPAHHHHPAASTGGQCIACHAPTTTYMGIDARHDHSFRIPRPDRSVSLGVPNACTQCHDKQPASWAAEQIRKWYPNAKPGHQNFAEVFAALEREQPEARPELLNLLRAPTTPAIVRASTLANLANHRGLLDSSLINAAYERLSDSDALVRSAAIRVVAGAPDDAKVYHLSPLLKDPLRLVRIDAARALAGSAEARLEAADRQAFEAALAEYVAAEAFNADRPEGNTNLGQLYADRGQLDQAIQAFRTAIKRDPSFAGGWLGLARVQERQGLLADALATLSQARQRLADSADLAHAEGLLRVRQQQRDAALAALRRATQLAPDNARYAYVYAVARHDYGDAAGAISTLKALVAQHPHHAEARSALTTYTGRQVGAGKTAP